MTETSTPPAPDEQPGTSASRAQPAVLDQTAALTWLAGVLGLVAVVVAFGQRSSDDAAAAVWFSVAATVAGLVAAAVGVVAFRRADGLHRSAAAAASWPTWSWWWVVGGVGLADVLAGWLVNGWVGLVGALLLGAALLGFGRDLASPPREVDRRLVVAARRLAAVRSGRAPGSDDRTSNTTTAGSDNDARTAVPSTPSAAVTRVGAVGARVVVFDSSGRLGDVVVADVQRGELAARLAGLPLVPADQLHPPLRTR